MFQVVAYEPGPAGTLIPTPALATHDEAFARRFYALVADKSERAGDGVSYGLDRYDPSRPTGWRELLSNRPGPVTDVHPRSRPTCA